MCVCLSVCDAARCVCPDSLPVRRTAPAAAVGTPPSRRRAGRGSRDAAPAQRPAADRVAAAAAGDAAAPPPRGRAARTTAASTATWPASGRPARRSSSRLPPPPPPPRPRWRHRSLGRRRPSARRPPAKGPGRGGAGQVSDAARRPGGPRRPLGAIEGRLAGRRCRVFSQCFACRRDGCLSQCVASGRPSGSPRRPTKRGRSQINGSRRSFPWDCLCNRGRREVRPIAVPGGAATVTFCVVGAAPRPLLHNCIGTPSLRASGGGRRGTR